MYVHRERMTLTLIFPAARCEPISITRKSRILSAGKYDMETMETTL